MNQRSVSLFFSFSPLNLSIKNIYIHTLHICFGILARDQVSFSEFCGNFQRILKLKKVKILRCGVGKTCDEVSSFLG